MIVRNYKGVIIVFLSVEIIIRAKSKAVPLPPCRRQEGEEIGL
jgi:hypothetical protein